MTVNVDERLEDADWPKKSWDLPTDLDDLLWAVKYHANPRRGREKLQFLLPRMPEDLAAQVKSLLQDTRTRAQAVVDTMSVKSVEDDIETKIRKRKQPRDADNDGLIYEGTPRERPAGPKTPRMVKKTTTIRKKRTAPATSTSATKKPPVAKKKTTTAKTTSKSTVRKATAAKKPVDPTKPKRDGRGMDVHGLNETRKIKGTPVPTRVAGRKIVEVEPGSADDTYLRERYGIPPAYTIIRFNVSRNEKDSDEDYDGFIYQAWSPEQERWQPVYTSRHWARSALKKHGADNGTDDVSEGDVTITVQNMPKLMKRFQADAKRNDTDGACARAIMIQALSGIRIGSDKDAKDKDARFGASTLEARHVTINKGSVTLNFMAKGRHKVMNPDGTVKVDHNGKPVWKKGKPYKVNIKDPALVKLMTTLMKDKKGRDRLNNASSTQVNKYLERVQADLKIKGGKITSHNFRHAYATTYAAKLIQGMTPPKSADDFRKKRKAVVEATAAAINDTNKIAFDAYIQHRVWDQWAKGHPAWKDQPL